MSNSPPSSRTFVVIGALIGCAALLTCVCVAAAGGAWLFARPTFAGLPAGVLGRSAAVNRIAYLGVDGNIHTVRPDGSDPQALTTDGGAGPGASRLYRFPTWSPDGRYVAFIDVKSQGGATDTQLVAAPVGGGAPQVLHKSGDAQPFYLYWSPDGRRLAFLESAGRSLALRLASLGQTDAPSQATGSPFYFVWSPDSRRLAAHIGGLRNPLSPEARVSLFEPGGSESAPVEEAPALFLAPDWSPDGATIVYARRAAAGGGNELVAADADGAKARSLLSFDGGVSFAWSPTGGHIAYIVSDSPALEGLGQIAYGKLGVMNPDGSGQRTLGDDSALSFFWSPDGTKLAYLAINADDQGVARLKLTVVDVATGETRTRALFTPTTGLMSVIPYFDQYLRSMRMWSPDSKSLVYTAREDGGGSGLYVVDAVSGEPTRIADAVDAAWSWQ
ncbi:MAG: hypothetical protein U0641_10230 [Anaerolineae bacterium]